MAVYISLRQFEGPLDLLLHLITKAKIDIKDIFVSEITEQYLDSMRGLDELDMDTASEFLTMAATLLEIKSRALLPRPPAEPEDGEETPEQALIRRLEEYTSEMALLLHEAPATIRSLTQQLQEGRLTLKVDVEHLENMDRVFDGVFNRLSSAIVMASLVIGSSIVVHANPKPHWYGTSIMGVIGFLISGVLGAILLFNMLHRRN